MVVANYVGKLSTIILKDPVKRLTQKDKDNISDKKRSNKDKKDNKKKKKSDVFDDDFDECDGSGESGDEMYSDKDMLSQQSQSSQLFDPVELAAIEVLR